MAVNTHATIEELLDVLFSVVHVISSSPELSSYLQFTL
jgi:hypothetical protein